MNNRAISVLLIGSGSFLGRALLARQSQKLRITAVSREALQQGYDPSEFDAVVNMAYHPNYLKMPYDESLDVDLAVARAVSASSAHYVMLSTRRVYGPYSPFPVTEHSACNPQDNYGRNKLRTETAVRALLGEQCTILRVANVFEYEPGRHTFFGIALERLRRDGFIALDVSPFVRRDFIHSSSFADALHDALCVLPPGIFNLGSGGAVELGRIALWLIEGYGQGKLIVESTKDFDNFLLDRSKFDQAVGLAGSTGDVRNRCIEIGRRLADA